MQLTTQISHKFRGFSLNLDFSASGRCVGIYGPSGAGKSLLCTSIAGLFKADSSKIHLDGEALEVSSDGTHVPAHERRIGIIFQDLRLFPHLSVRDNLVFGWKRNGRRANLEQIYSLLDITDLLDRSCIELSRGQQQRVAIARALAASPRLLIMDEPTSSLDSSHQHEFLQYLAAVVRENITSMIYVSHRLSEIQLLCDTLVIIKDGQAIDCQPTNDLLTSLDHLSLVDPFAIVSQFSSVYLGATLGATPGATARATPGATEDVGVFQTEFGLIHGSAIKADVGHKCRLMIRASEVSLTAEPTHKPTDAVIAPQIAVRVKIIREANGFHFVKLDLVQPDGKTTGAIIARLNSAQIRDANITLGQAMYARINNFVVAL